MTSARGARPMRAPRPARGAERPSFAKLRAAPAALVTAGVAAVHLAPAVLAVAGFAAARATPAMLSAAGLAAARATPAVLSAAGLAAARIAPAVLTAAGLTLSGPGCKSERAATTVFWFAVSSLVPLGLAMLMFGRTHDPTTWMMLAGLALAGGLAQLTLTGALRLAPVALVMPMDYTSLLWALLLGSWVFSEVPSPWIGVGAPIIIASGLVIVWREHRLHRLAALSAEAAAPT